MLSTPDGPFINLARLDMSKYAAKPTLAKALFEYIFHHENDIRNVRRMFLLPCCLFLVFLSFFIALQYIPLSLVNKYQFAVHFNVLEVSGKLI